MKICKETDCNRARYCRGWCRMHYERWRAHGDPTINKNDKGGIRNHRMYGAWSQMINRCHNPNNSSYQRYGARGIFVCDRWRADFRHFLADMGERPDGKTLDRIDPSGPYAPDNCRWATPSEQRANISKDGDARTRAALSSGVKRSWARRKANPAKQTCRYCGAEFPSPRGDALFCSKSCDGKYRYRLRSKAAEALE